MRVILVAEHASIDFGGEAALPCHYFRIFLSRDVDVYLIVHERSKKFLSEAFPDSSQRIIYVSDTFLHRILYSFQKLLPARLGSMTFGFGLRMLTQLLQKRIIEKLIKTGESTIVHQVIPVSPKEPSIMSGLGVPVVFGPLNGGMNYPHGFEAYESRISLKMNEGGRWLSGPVNYFCSGKRKAAAIMVANERTRNALNKNIKGVVYELVENGVDLSIWREPEQDKNIKNPTFTFVGRLVDWKAVDILLDAFYKAADKYGTMKLRIIGDGDQRSLLESIVNSRVSDNGTVIFHGWLSQIDVYPYLNQSTALVLPSLYECGGAVVLEAMATGLPVISTNWGGPADYLDSECGILIDPVSREALVERFSEAMILLSENPILAHNMGLHGRQKVVRTYNWEKKANDVLDIYHRHLEIAAD